MALQDIVSEVSSCVQITESGITFDIKYYLGAVFPYEFENKRLRLFSIERGELQIIFTSVRSDLEV